MQETYSFVNFTTAFKDNDNCEGCVKTRSIVKAVKTI